MSSSKLIRLSGLASIVGGSFVVLTRVLQVGLFGSQPLSIQALSPSFVIALGIPGLLGSICLSLGIIGLYARQAYRIGTLGLVVFLVAYVGLSLSLGANWAYAFASPYLGSTAPSLLDTSFSEPAWGVFGTGFLVSYLLGAISWLLMSVVTIIAAVLPRWVGSVMLAGMLLAAILPLGTLGLPAIILNLLLGLGPIVFGYALWAELGEGQKDTVAEAA
jgi:hypothetical protein